VATGRLSSDVMPAAPAGFFLGYTTAPMRTLSSSLLFSLLAVAACRGGGDGGPDGPRGGDAPPNPDDTSIYDIQNPDGRVAEGTTLTIKGVVVTAIDRYGMRTGNFWVEEPGGGPYSGVLVFGADPNFVGTLQPGDIVDISGASKTEFALDTDPTPRKTTELEPGDSGSILVTRVSGGTPLQPDMIDALAIARMDDSGTRPTARDNEFEKWEGVLIEIENVTQMSAVAPIGSTDPTFEGFGLNGGLETDTSLAAFPSGVDGDICIASITGIGDYFFNWKILPRETGEMVLGGTGCPPPEEGPTMCGDGMDNDSDGYADCDDRSCQSTDPACVTTTSISAIQMGTVTGSVELDNVFVSAVTFNRKHLYVQDALAGAPYNGVYVYRGGGAAVLPAEIVPGATVNIAGTTTEYMGFTEINFATVTFVAAPTGLPTPATTEIATLIDPTAGEPYEGVYVRVSNAAVSSVVAMNPDFYYTLSNSGASIIADDDIYRASPTDGECYASVSGIFSYNGFTTPVAPHVNLLPTLATDLVPGGTCP
jgi:hypothetical protein